MSERPIAVRPAYVAVIGDGDPSGPDAHRILEWAEEIGMELARAGATVVTGGLGGVMRAASRGARGGGGKTIGILPGADASEANEYVSIAIPTGLGVVRNLVVVTSADAVIAVGGRHGTLSRSAWRCAWGARSWRSAHGASSRSTAWAARASTAPGILARLRLWPFGWPLTGRSTRVDSY